MYYYPVEPNISVAALFEDESFLNLYGLFADKTHAHANDKLHYHDYFQLYYTVSGSYTHTINGVTKTCTAGDVSLIMPYTVHGLNTTVTNFEETTIIAISFLPNVFHRKKIPFYPISFTRAAFIDKYIPTSMTLSGEDKLRADELMQSIYSEHEKHSNMFITTILKHLNEFFRICIRAAGSTVTGMVLPARITVAEQIYNEAKYIKKNHTEKLTIDRAAERASMSRSTFTKNFREVIGMSYHDLHNSIRLAFAILDMRYTRKSIAEIADERGYSSQAHFTKVCISAFSLPPHTLRNEMARLTREHSMYTTQRDQDVEWAYIRASEIRKEHYKASIGEDY